MKLSKWIDKILNPVSPLPEVEVPLPGRIIHDMRGVVELKRETVEKMFQEWSLKANKQLEVLLKDFEQKLAELRGQYEAKRKVEKRDVYMSILFENMRYYRDKFPTMIAEDVTERAFTLTDTILKKLEKEGMV